MEGKRVKMVDTSGEECIAEQHLEDGIILLYRDTEDDIKKLVQAMSEA